MCQLLARCFLLGALLSAVDSKGTFYGGHVNPFYGNRYNLYKAGLSPHHSPNKPMTRHKNHCAYVVHKNITCTMQDGVATYVKAEYTTKCIWGQKCPVVMYRTFYKPTYKVGYKTVTELEWRCCPGYSGDNCHEGPTSTPDDGMPPFKGAGLPYRPGLKGYPHGPRPPVDVVPGGGQLEPGRPFPGMPDRGTVPTGQLPAGSGRPNYGVTGERLDRMEEDLRRLTQGLDTLNGVVAGLEERLRTSLREDTNKILVSLLPNPPRVTDPVVGFGTIPDGSPDGLDGGEGFPGFGDLAGRVTEVKDELRAKTHIIEEIQGMVLGHDNQLKRLLEGARGRPIPPGPSSSGHLDEILDVKLAGVRADILSGFERRLSNLENHCDVKIGEVQKQCHKDHLDGQEQMQQSLDGRETGIREELGSLQAQIQGLTLTESCCGQVNSLSHRVLLLEESVKGLTESQRQLQNALSEQAVHVETLIETRLVDIQGRLNATDVDADGVTGLPGGLDGFKTMLEDKLKTLEERVFVAVEELSNATAPALLEGQVVPALETEIESVRTRVELDLGGLQKQIHDLELLCTSSCSPSAPPAEGVSVPAGGGGEGCGEECGGTEGKVGDRLDAHADKLGRLNATLQQLLLRLARQETEGGVHGEITLLKVNINSVNRTLKGLRDSLTYLTSEVGHANSSWEQREHQLVNQVHGITRLVGHQASVLGAGERRLAQLKGELAALRRRLSGELQGCRSTAIEVQREVKDVDSRVSRVEGQCSSLGELAEHLERIRAELERHSDLYLSRMNGTLAAHSEQLAQLKGEVKNRQQGDQ